MNERRVVLTYKLGWIMLWNFPSFSFLEIANIKLLFEIGLWAELNSVKTTNFHNVLSSQKTLSVWRYRVSTTYLLVLCGAGWAKIWPEEGIGHPHLTPLSHCQVPDSPHSSHTKLQHHFNLSKIYIVISMWENYLIFPPMLLNWSLQ